MWLLHAWVSALSSSPLLSSLLFSSPPPLPSAFYLSRYVRVPPLAPRRPLLWQSGTIDKDEAVKFWGSNFAKVNASAMFNEVDVDKDGSLTLAEWKEFWRNVLKHKYSAEDVLEEVDSMMKGGSWVDWNDGRST
jgi:hypothetical protein